MDDKRNDDTGSIVTPRPVRGPARSKRRWGTSVVVALCVGLAASSLVGCTPATNRKIGLQTFANAGVSRAVLARIDCIMYRESRYQNAASHLNMNGTVDRGLFQINSIHAVRWREVTHTSYWTQWKNPYLNARYALSLYRVAGLSPWRGGCLR